MVALSIKHLFNKNQCFHVNLKHVTFCCYKNHFYFSNRFSEFILIDILNQSKLIMEYVLKFSFSFYEL